MSKGKVLMDQLVIISLDAPALKVVDGVLKVMERSIADAVRTSKKNPVKLDIVIKDVSDEEDASNR